jgi:RND family efflux transporter MFP subunit
MSVDKGSLAELRIDRNESEVKKGRRGRFGFAVALVLLLALAGWFFFRSKGVVVKTSPVRAADAGNAKTVLNASGYVTARRQATVSSKITGKVVEVLVEEGFKVEAGQVIARLDATNTLTSLNLALAQFAVSESSMEETRALLRKAEKEFKRASELARANVSSESALDLTLSEMESLQARLRRQSNEVAVAGCEVAVWRQQVDDAVIRAPFAGVVISKNAQPGEMISPISAGGGYTRTGICTIVDMSSLETEVDVNESYINRVEAGQPVIAALDSYPDWKIPCKVIAIIPAADRQKATVKVRIGFDKLDPRILPDMGVKVAFQRTGDAGGQASALTVAKNAIWREGSQAYAFVVKNGRLEKRAVKTGEVKNEDCAVLEGLFAGETIVIEGQQKLKDGMVVQEKKR